jgi:2'-hydroxyisoflavone reductase
MKLLVLGGTVFVGRHLVEAALVQGHQVTLLNRGRRSPGLFPDAEHLIGDRDGDLSALRGRRFDAVIDCSGYTPAQMRSTLNAFGVPTGYESGPGPALAQAVGHYVFISSVSAYACFPPGRPYDETADRAAGDTGYGALKARSEDVLTAALPGHVTIVRPGLIVGPHDPTGRFTYWPTRVAAAVRAPCDVLAPGRPGRQVQFIDVRDLAQWCLHLAMQRIGGAFNAVAPGLTMAALLDACAAVGAEVARADSPAGTAAEPRFVWLDDTTLRAEGVEPWTGLPLWLAEDDLDFGGLLQADDRRARAAGLTTRPVRDTVADTLRWASSPDVVPSPGAGDTARGAPLAPADEARILRRHAPPVAEPV